MEELYLIMRDFLEVEYDQESLMHLLKMVEAGCTDKEQIEAKLLVNSIKYNLKALQEELKSAIGRLDFYIAENANNNRIV